MQDHCLQGNRRQKGDNISDSKNAGKQKAKALYTAPNHGKDCFFSLSFVSYFINIQKQPTKLEILKLKIRTICIFSYVCCKFYQTKVQFSWKFVKEKAN